MFKFFNSAPRFTKEDKDQIASSVYDIAIESTERGFKGKSDEAIDLFADLFTVAAVSVATSI